MNNCRYRRIIVIGCGTIANTVMRYVILMRGVYGYKCEFVSHDTSMDPTIRLICQKEDVLYKEIADKNELEGFFSQIDEITLVISAGNYYIFPKTVIDNECLSIINFHNALLPRFPGINAPSWCIFEGEKTTGITWHYVTNDIDAGDILYQNSCSIGEDDRAFQLVAKLMGIAQNGLEAIFPSVLDGTIEARKQVGSRGPMCYSDSIPSNGRFDLKCDPVYIYRLLRSVDYGKMPIFPAVRFTYNGNDCEVIRYKKCHVTDKIEKDGWISLKIDNEFLLQIKYRIISD